jgi:hypothetical protein
MIAPSPLARRRRRELRVEGDKVEIELGATETPGEADAELDGPVDGWDYRDLMKDQCSN